MSIIRTYAYRYEEDNLSVQSFSDIYTGIIAIVLSTGPFSILYKALNERKLIHIWTRSYNKLRGICRGYLAAFDKHMNIVS